MQLVLGIPESKVRVIAPDVGGGFGSKLNAYAEEYLAVALARRLGRPVKWIEERAENYQATIHGRDVATELTFAATKDGRITARLEGSFGLSAFEPPADLRQSGAQGVHVPRRHTHRGDATRTR